MTRSTQLVRQLVGISVLIATVLGFAWIHAAWDPAPDLDRQIVLVVEDASGLREGAPIRHRGVNVGEVVAIDLDPTGRFVELQCAFRGVAAPSLRTTSQFWVVRPVFFGVAGGAAGLDTLIRDPYIAYDTRPGASETLEWGARVPARSKPPRRSGDGRSASPDDLRCTILFEDASGLEPDAEVRHRGITVGTVDSVELVADGRAVAVACRIRREFRNTVRRDSAFWIARPIVDAGLSGIRVQDLEAILRGSALEYGGGSGSPAANGLRFAGVSREPESADDAAAFELFVRGLDGTDLRTPASGAGDAIDPVVAVLYEFVEEDPIASDEFTFTSAGVLFESADRRFLVAVPKSAIDGASLVEDGYGEPEITEERRTIILSNGQVAAVSPVWRSSEHDLALLSVDTTLEGVRALDTSVLAFDEAERDGGGEIVRFAGSARVDPVAATRSGSTIGHGVTVTAEAPLFGVVRTGGKIIGFAVQLSAGGDARFVPLSAIPGDLRPASKR